jgi:hypothetical protein
MKDDVSKESEARRQEMEAKTESGKLRAESDHGEGANVHRSTPNSEGETETEQTSNAQCSTTNVKRSAANYDLRRINLAEGERKFLEALMKFTAGAKRSQEPEVAVAARRWEGKIHFQVRVAQQRKRES